MILTLALAIGIPLAVIVYVTVATVRKDGSGGRQPMREFRTDEVVT